jgi:photosystem II stability/assembly factor-like uncharacterized protein
MLSYYYPFYVHNNFAMKKLTFITLLLLSLSSSVSAQVFWQQTPGGPQDGSVYGLTVDSLQRVYVTTGGAGVFQSTDHGLTWHGFSEGLRILPVRWIESSTFENEGGDTVAYVYALSHRKELMRRIVNKVSTDSRWEYLQNIIDSSSTLDVNQMMTNAKGYFYLATANFGVLRSRDDGKTFDQPLDKKHPLPDSFIECMAVDGRTQNLYAVSDNSQGGKNYVSHISRSTDDGTTWQHLPNIPPVPVNLVPQYCMVIGDDGSINIGYQVRYHPDLVEDDSTMVFRSTDQGQTWIPSLIVNPPVAEQSVVKMLHACRGNALYLNMHGPTWRSLDNGATWQKRDPEKRGDEFFDLVCDSSNRLYRCATPDGVFRSVDSGLTFTDFESLAVQHLDGGMAINSNGDVFSTSNFSIFRSTDHGNSWTTLPHELEEANFPMIICDKENYVYFSHYFGMYRSKDNGDNFDQIIKVDSPMIPTNQVYYIGVSPKDELWASMQWAADGTGGDPWFARSKDHGDTWTRVNSSGLQGIPPFQEIDAFGFSVGSDPNVDDTIYAAGNSQNIYRSINDGQNWDIINSEGNGIKQFICDPDGSVFRVQSGPAGNSGAPGDTTPVLTGGIYRSLDGGVTWTKVFPTAAQHFVDTVDYFNVGVVPMILDRQGRLMIGTVDSGFWRSTNADFSQWENVSAGYVPPDWDPHRPINSSQIVQDSKTGVFYSGSRGYSVFRSGPDLAPLDAVPMSQLSPSIAEPVNYPNPFVKSTEIGFNVPNSGYVKISIYDVMGRLMQVVYDGYMEQGAHSVPYNANAMISTGKYLIVLQSGSSQTSHWMTVMK